MTTPLLVLVLVEYPGPKHFTGFVRPGVSSGGYKRAWLVTLPGCTCIRTHAEVNRISIAGYTHNFQYRGSFTLFVQLFGCHIAIKRIDFLISSISGTASFQAAIVALKSAVPREVRRLALMEKRG